MRVKTLNKRGVFNRDSLTVEFGGQLSIPGNKFIATAIKVPEYKYQVTERESLGGGWYGSQKITYEKTENNLYVIIRDGVCIGMMLPYFQSGLKSELLHLNKQAIDFLNKQGIPFNQ